ncbi:hypothetical protein T439DRAFT_336547 [Meredithblackwellia eburnea MCA 4105]
MTKSPRILVSRSRPLPGHGTKAIPGVRSQPGPGRHVSCECVAPELKTVPHAPFVPVGSIPSPPPLLPFVQSAKLTSPANKQLPSPPYQTLDLPDFARRTSSSQGTANHPSFSDLPVPVSPDQFSQPTISSFKFPSSADTKREGTSPLLSPSPTPLYPYFGFQGQPPLPPADVTNRVPEEEWERMDEQMQLQAQIGQEQAQQDWNLLQQPGSYISYPRQW